MRTVAVVDLPQNFRRHPLRVAVAIGLTITAIASIQPWVAGTDAFGRPVAIDGLAGPGDGGFFTLFGIGMAFAVLTRAAAEAKAAPIRLLPAVIAAVLIVTVLTAQVDAETQIGGVEYEGGHAAVTPAFWAASGGALLMAAAGAWLTVLDRLRRGPWFKSGDVGRALAWRSVMPSVTAVVGAFLGFGGVVFVAARAFGSAFALLFVVGGIVGGMLGGWLGYRVGHWLTLTPPARRPP